MQTNNLEPLTLDGDFVEYRIPKGYDLNNKLLFVIVYDFLDPYLFDLSLITDINALRLKLATVLAEKLKLPFTNVTLELINNQLKGEIQYTEGKSLSFTLTTSAHEQN